VQLAKAIGARVATTIASSAAAALASSLGADETINYRDEKVEAYVDRLTAGHGLTSCSTRSAGTIFSR
jgi:NADPH2:quinone reductase